MFVEAPIGEPAKIGKNLFLVGMENMWPIRVNEDTTCVMSVEGVAANMWPSIDDEHGMPGGGEPFGAHRAGETRADNEENISAHHYLPFYEANYKSRAQSVPLNKIAGSARGFHELPT